MGVRVPQGIAFVIDGVRGEDAPEFELSGYGGVVGLLPFSPRVYSSRMGTSVPSYDMYMVGIFWPRGSSRTGDHEAMAERHKFFHR